MIPIGRRTAFWGYILLAFLSAIYGLLASSGDHPAILGVVLGLVVWMLLVYGMWRGIGVAWGLLVVGTLFALLDLWVIAPEGEPMAVVESVVNVAALALLVGCRFGRIENMVGTPR